MKVPSHVAPDPALTEIRRTEQQLAEAQALAHVGSWDWDLVTDRYSVSDEYNRILGIPVGHPVSVSDAVKRVHPDDRAMIERVVAQARTTNQPYTLVFRIQRPDGSERTIESHTKIEVNAAGRPIRHHGTIQDITDRRRAEQLLDLRVRQQAAVARFGEAAAFGGDLDDLLECGTALVAETLDVEYVQVLELRPDGTFVMRAGRGWNPGVGPVGDAEVTGISVPIGSPKRPFGMLRAHSIAPRPFTPDDMNFLQAVASLLAASIARHRAEDVRQHLLARAISAQEEERQRVARELHDETGQALTAILVGLKNVETTAAGTEAESLARDLRRLVAATLRDVGRIARGLRPSALDDLGLIPALQRYGDELGAARALAVHIHGDHTKRFPLPVETTLYRIIQEALTNVAAHAHAQSVHVAIRRSSGAVHAVVQDDGSGFDLEAAQDSGDRRQPLGLIGMHERASLLGGSVVVDSRFGAGTTLTVTLPL